jgi:hypothetical protein
LVDSDPSAVFLEQPSAAIRSHRNSEVLEATPAEIKALEEESTIVEADEEDEEEEVVKTPAAAITDVESKDTKEASPSLPSQETPVHAQETTAAAVVPSHKSGVNVEDDEEEEEEEEGEEKPSTISATEKTDDVVLDSLVKPVSDLKTQEQPSAEGELAGKSVED